MSNRTLIEINHDYTHRLDAPAFLATLRLYLASGSREAADDLELFGIRVLSMRHHSGKFYIDADEDGFPAITRPKP